MKVKDLMTTEITCCTPETGLSEVARSMKSEDCGCIPVIDSRDGNSLLGVITDRDIVCRSIAEGKNPIELTAKDCMSKPSISVTPEMDIAECNALMETHQIRRLPVVESQESKVCCGMISLADIATRTPSNEAGKIVRAVSQPQP